MENKEVSWQEFFVGAASTFLLFFVFGISEWILFAATAGVLWMMGGTIWKGLRRFGVPIMICQNVSLIKEFEWIYLLAVVSGIAILHIGDGFPDYRPTTVDEGSWLGRRVREILYIWIHEESWSEQETKIQRIGGPITKWIVPVLFQVSLIPYWYFR